MVEGAHIVQSVGKFYKNNAEIFDHRQKHLSIGFRLANFPILVMETCLGFFELLHQIIFGNILMTKHIFSRVVEDAML